MKHFLLFVCLSVPVFGQYYELPNDDNDCPDNCRMIPWLTGADVWNGDSTPGGGSLPVRTGVSCGGLTEGTGTTDNTSAIESCLAAISSGQASLIPPGIYYVNGTLNVPGNKSLRGSGAFNCSQGGYLSPSFRGDTGVGAACTTIRLGTNGTINVFTGSGASLGTTYNLSSGYTKGSTAVVTSTTPTNLAVGDYVILSQTNDSSIPVTETGENGDCTWCGLSSGTRIMTQVAIVTNKSSNTITLNRPLYYNFESGFTPQITEITGTIEQAGLEDVKVDGYVYRTTRTDALVELDGCMKCWVTDSEIYMAPASSNAFHIYLTFTYAVEIRDGYYHSGVDNDSGQDYSPGFFGPNSDGKVENNTMRENRHALTCEGGCSGMAFLFNYVDDQYDGTDLSYLGSGRINHGGHPYMNLLEGNIISHYAADSVWGSSSHQVWYRNWLWGDATGNYSGWSNVGAGTPDYGFAAIDISDIQHYYALVGNVLGRSDNLHANWNNATLNNSSCGTDPTRATPVVFYLGCLTAYGTPTAGRDTSTLSTMIRQGNYDYKTDGVANWADANHDLAPGLYYSSKPAFFGTCSWPIAGPDLTGQVTENPAMLTYQGMDCPTAGTSSSSTFGSSRIFGSMRKF